MSIDGRKASSLFMGQPKDGGQQTVRRSIKREEKELWSGTEASEVKLLVKLIRGISINKIVIISNLLGVGRELPC